MAANERRCHQVTAGLALPSPGDSTKKVPKPRNRGTGPKLFSKCVTREMLQGQFHLPMEEAGKSWGVSTTIVKRVCRTFGIERWPYRQIQSARKRIDKLQEKLRAGGRTATEREKIKVRVRGACACAIIGVSDVYLVLGTIQHSTVRNPSLISGNFA